MDDAVSTRTADTLTTAEPARAGAARTSERPARRGLRLRRTAVATALVATALLAASATATTASASAPASASAAMTLTAADPVTTPAATVEVDGDQVTITVDLTTVQRLCASAPRAQDRLSALVERIEGGADVTGSSAWLTARSGAASAAGRETLAEQLADRAERRAAHVPELQAALTRVEQARATLCSAIPDAS